LSRKHTIRRPCVEVYDRPDREIPSETGRITEINVPKGEIPGLYPRVIPVVDIPDIPGYFLIFPGLGDILTVPRTVINHHTGPPE